MSYELAISKSINHYTGAESFEIVEHESGERVTDGHGTYAEALLEAIKYCKSNENYRLIANHNVFLSAFAEFVADHHRVFKGYPCEFLMAFDQEILLHQRDFFEYKEVTGPDASECDVYLASDTTFNLIGAMRL